MPAELISDLLDSYQVMTEEDPVSSKDDEFLFYSCIDVDYNIVQDKLIKLREETKTYKATNLRTEGQPVDSKTVKY